MSEPTKGPWEVNTGNEPLEFQVERLADFIITEIPGEPSRSEGAIDTAIRWMKERITASGETVGWQCQIHGMNILSSYGSCPVMLHDGKDRFASRCRANGRPLYAVATCSKCGTYLSDFLCRNCTNNTSGGA